MLIIRQERKELRVISENIFTILKKWMSVWNVQIVQGQIPVMYCNQVETQHHP